MAKTFRGRLRPLDLRRIEHPLDDAPARDPTHRARPVVTIGPERQINVMARLAPRAELEHEIQPLRDIFGDRHIAEHRGLDLSLPRSLALLQGPKPDHAFIGIDPPGRQLQGLGDPAAGPVDDPAEHPVGQVIEGRRLRQKALTLKFIQIEPIAGTGIEQAHF